MLILIPILLEIVVALDVCVSENSGGDRRIDQGESTTLTANGSSGMSPFTFSWSNGLGSGASQTVSPTITTM